MMDGNESDLQSSEIAQILRSIGEDYGFDPETCAEIAALPFEEAFQDAYGYLVQAGIDPDEILSQYIQQTNYE